MKEGKVIANSKYHSDRQCLYLSDDIKNALSTYGLGNIWLFYDGNTYNKETIPLICSANQWTDFCMIGTSVMKELINYMCGNRSGV